jgi:endo-beta-N-acetylglucosaminidase D
MSEKQVISTAAAESNRQASPHMGNIRFSKNFPYWVYIKLLVFPTGIHSCSAYSKEISRGEFLIIEARRVKLK